MKIMQPHQSERKFTLLLVVLFAFSIFGDGFSEEWQPSKKKSTFYPPVVIARIQKNAKSNPDMAKEVARVISVADRWQKFSDEELWSLMFGSTMSRSWMVWSDGFCPSCKNPVVMYNWKIDPFNHPWKVQCPHCGEFFPKNDFYAFYRSGLDEHGVFSPGLADRSLLFNAVHPDKSDSLRNFGVDDGEGYAEGGNRWRFIGDYLIYGQWKKLVLDGIRYQAAAYVLTGDNDYAHRAGILLDRVADLYPTFDFARQAFVYEKKDTVLANGYVSVWHDACEETRELAIAYDMIFDAIKHDQSLVKFLHQQAQKYHLSNQKSSFKDIQANIEQNILIDAIENRYKTESNFPKTDMAMAIYYSILDWEKNRGTVMNIIDKFITKGTKFDGLTGEKGLDGYASLMGQALARFFQLYQHVEPDFLGKMFCRYPQLRQTFRFHIDTWFNEMYYPKVGDGGVVGKRTLHFKGVKFTRKIISKSLSDYAFCSMYSFFWDVFKITGDADFVKILYKENHESVRGLPYDLLEDNPPEFQQKVRHVIDSVGTKIKIKSFNKKGWCLALLTSGNGENKRAVYLNYSSGGNHYHADGMNIGLFAYGLDLLPGFGYPPVQFGGWHSKKALWYRKTAAHNTVIVDWEDQIPRIGERETAPMSVQLNPAKKLRRGKTTLEGFGKKLKIIRVVGDSLYHEKPLKKYERTVALIDIAEDQFFVLDIFRVCGGKEHAKFYHGYFGTLKTSGLKLKKWEALPPGVEIYDVRGDAHPKIGWQATWKINDYYDYLPEGQQVFMRYTDFTNGAAAAIGNAWVAFEFSNPDSAYLPSLIVSKKSEKPDLRSTFAGILEVFDERPAIKNARRVEISSSLSGQNQDGSVALEIETIGGEKLLVVSPDYLKNAEENQRWATVPDWDLQTDAEFALFKKNKSGEIEYFSLANGSYAKVGRLKFHLPDEADFMEAKVSGKKVERLFGEE